MVFAAGLGTRLRPLTERVPKPLVEVGGRSMLERALDALERAGIELAVVNTHHLAEQVHARVADRRRQGRGPEVVLAHEQPVLETGGGIVNALGLLGDEPFVSLNADVVWLDGPTPALSRLAAAFEPGRMDALLLVHPRERAVGYTGPGDFALAPDGELRRAEVPPRPFVFTGLQIWHPRAFDGREARPFSLGDLYRERRGAGQRLRGLYGLPHDGAWLHVGTAAELDAACRYLSIHE